MAETIATGADAHDEDRLPWLESAEPEPTGRAPAWRLVAMLLVALAVVLAIVFAFLHHRGDQGVAGTGELINAQEGAYKVKPGNPGGMQVEGRGDQVFATSEGDASNGSVDLAAVPEAPVTGTPAARVAPTATPTSSRVVTAVPAPGGRLEARAPARSPATAIAANGSGGAVVQLGSFPAESGANAAWNQLSRRFAYLAPLGKSVQRAEVNGATVYRLRVNAGSSGQASELCGKLQVVGEACFVAH